MEAYDKTLDASAPLDAGELAFLNDAVEPGLEVAPLQPHEVAYLERIIPPEYTVGRRLLSTLRPMVKLSPLARVRGWWMSVVAKRKPNTVDGRRLITSILQRPG